MALVAGAGARAEATLRFETKDWIFTAPASLGTQDELELVGRSVQICHDEVVTLIGHRPRRPAKFRVVWVIDGKDGSYATPEGWVNHVPDRDSRFVSEEGRSSLEQRVAQDVCMGPHELVHVLTWESGAPSWAREGFATFADRVYEWSGWRCCSSPPPLEQSCDTKGYTLWGKRYPYRDLSPFRIDFASYSTAACLWIELHARAGFPAIRGLLAGMRARPPGSTGDFVAHHVNRVLNVDLRPVVLRYGFTRRELQAGPVPEIPGCTLVGSRRGDTIAGTAGADVVCGLAGDDRLWGASGRDVLDGGTGDDTINARDGRRDVVRGGDGRDTAQIDRELDHVADVEELLP